MGTGRATRSARRLCARALSLSLIVALLVALGAGAAAPVRADPPDPAALREEAEAAEAAGRRATARELWLALAASADPQHRDHAMERLEAAAEGGAPEDLEALAQAWLAREEPAHALEALEVLLDRRGAPEDRVRYAGALLAIVRPRIAAGAARSLDVAPHLADALAALEGVPAGSPAHPAALALRGEALWLEGEFEGAVDAWTALPAEALGPEVTYARTLLGQALWRLGRFGEAAAAFQAAGDRRGAASAWTAARDGAKALDAWESLLREGPVEAALLEDAVRAARFLGAEARLDGVLAELDAAAADDPSGGGAARARLLEARGSLAESLGMLEAAAAHLDAAAAEDPEAVEPLLALGRVRLLARPGEVAGVEGAIQAWLAALQRAPQDERVRTLLWDMAAVDYASIWRSPAATERTLRVQNALVEADPEDALAWANLGNSLRLAGHHAEAVAAYDEAVKLAPEDPLVHSDRGLALSALGRKEDALAAFQEAARIDERFDPAHQNAARHLMLEGRLDEATLHLARALEAARQQGQGAQRYRFLLDRLWRLGRGR